MTLTSRQQRLLWLSVALSAAGYLVFALWSGWREVGLAMQRIGATAIAVALALSLLNYLLRGERWREYLAQAGHLLSWRLNTRIYWAGFALTTTPGKAGEMIRSLFLAPYGVRFHQSAAMFFSERLADLVAIVCLTAAGLGRFHQGEWVYAALVLVLVAGLLLLRTTWPERILRRLAGARAAGRWLAEVAASSRPYWQGRLFWWVLLLSLTAWFAEGVGAWLILRQLSVPVDFEMALFIYGFAMLVGALSFMPGGLGGTEATMTGLLVLEGLPLPEAVAATVIIRLATLWFAVILGLLAVLTLPAPPAAEEMSR
ncbi:lysylphosphatidylglycerol synthase transmembrane domain-containing protein [Perlucidibaca piscinae]|uniref:lysylphosphatidylglycerol synthase transmembrane domain-containing protein n=1 Tax=Perlucidibaca piscinae TaxID=392589 RepID=UPI0003B5F3FD|nr:lysylphosphatidylglycerol synthase transmembrane domain-containing protein [Perlucidibaca piscinae]